MTRVIVEEIVFRALHRGEHFVVLESLFLDTLTLLFGKTTEEVGAERGVGHHQRCAEVEESFIAPPGMTWH